MDVWIGSYPPAGLGSPVGQGEGLWRLSIGDASETAPGPAAGRLAATQATVQPAPSFVLAHPAADLVYAVREDQPSVLTVHDGRSGAQVAEVVIGGAHGCHLSLSPARDAVYVANYGSGDLAVVRIGADGLPLSAAPDQLLGHVGTGPRADRQEGPHAHFSAPSPDGHHLLVADLGTDELRRYAIGPGGLLGDAGIAATLPAGSGPRHLVVRGELIYVVCELDHQLRTLRWDRASATAELVAEHPTTLVAQRSGEDVFDAHVAVVERQVGDVLLVSVRGADVISVFDIAPEGELSYRAAFDAGEWPRHFEVLGQWLIVAASREHRVRAYTLADVLALAPEMERGAVAALPYASAEVVSPASIAGRSALAPTP